MDGDCKIESVEVDLDSELNLRVMDMRGSDLMEVMSGLAHAAKLDGCEEKLEAVIDQVPDVLTEVMTAIAKRSETSGEELFLMAAAIHSLMATLLAHIDMEQMHAELDEIEGGAR